MMSGFIPGNYEMMSTRDVREVYYPKFAGLSTDCGYPVRYCTELTGSS